MAVRGGQDLESRLRGHQINDGIDDEFPREPVVSPGVQNP